MLINDIYPIVRAVIPKSAKPIGAEDYQELVQDTMASAAKMIESVERRGKKLMPNSIAYYAIQQTKSGRRSYSATVTDVMAPGFLISHPDALCSMENLVDSEGELQTVGEMLAARHGDPSTNAVRRIDWEAFLEQQDRRVINIVRDLLAGYCTSELALKYGVTPPRIVQIKREIAEAVSAYMGSDILAVAGEEPTWKRDLERLHNGRAAFNGEAHDPETVQMIQAVFG